jgi:hypothetical protein
MKSYIIYIVLLLTTSINVVAFDECELKNKIDEINTELKKQTDLKIKKIRSEVESLYKEEQSLHKLSGFKEMYKGNINYKLSIESLILIKKDLEYIIENLNQDKYYNEIIDTQKILNKLNIKVNSTYIDLTLI